MGLALVSWCAVVAAALPVADPPRQVDLAEAVAVELQAGRFVEALRLAGEAREPALAARLEAEVRWTAGDLDGALAAAQEGLSAVPGDARLASTAADLALTLGLAEEARRHLGTVDQALADPTWSAETSDDVQRWWRERRAGLEALALEAENGLAARDSALRRARVVGGGFVVLGVLAFVVLLIRPGTSPPLAPRRD